MPTRRFHSKTRTGCRQCKERKSKTGASLDSSIVVADIFECDETKPTCENCSKRNVTCSFVSDQSTLIVIESQSARISSQFKNNANAPKIEADRVTHEDAPYHIEQLSLAKTYSLKGDKHDTFRLLHHYAISTCYSISDPISASESFPLRDLVPALAFDHDFLLSGLLAVTSLHLALLAPSPLHTTSAIAHHATALSQVSPHLTTISPSNVFTLFSFSCLIALYSFGFKHTQSPSLDPLADILEVFILTRGIRIIFRDGAQWLQRGPFASSMLPNPENPTASLEPKIEAALCVLTERTAQVTNEMARDAYTAALDLLRQTFILMAEKPSAKMNVLLFPILVPDEFMQLLKEREGLALVILANYAVVLHRLRGYIWLRGWGKDIIDAVNHAIGMEWGTCLELAVKEVEKEDGEE